MLIYFSLIIVFLVFIKFWVVFYNNVVLFMILFRLSQYETYKL